MRDGLNDFFFYLVTEDPLLAPEEKVDWAMVPIALTPRSEYFFKSDLRQENTQGAPPTAVFKFAAEQCVGPNELLLEVAAQPPWETHADATEARGKRALTVACLHNPLFQTHQRAKRQCGLSGEAKHERERVLNNEAAKRYRARKKAARFRQLHAQ